jgi:hypothetical protein
MPEKRVNHRFVHYPNQKGYECKICGEKYSLLLSKLNKEYIKEYRRCIVQTFYIIDSVLDKYYPCLTESEAMIKDIIE